MRKCHVKTACFFLSLMCFPVLCPPDVFARPAADFPHKIFLNNQNQQKMAEILERKRNNPAKLRMFLQDFPKGADLHNHLIGAVYAESFLNWAEADGNCIDLQTNEISSGACPKPRLKSKISGTLLMDRPKRREALIDVMSMRHFVARPGGETGHDHFFNAFHHIGLTPYRNGDMLAEARTRAARDHVQYLELMISPDLSGAMGAGQNLSDDNTTDTQKIFKKWHQEIQPFLSERLEKATEEIDQAQKRSDGLLFCHQKSPRAGCSVNTRYLYQAIRTATPKEVFAQLAIGYALAAQDPRFAGVNFVAPEDAPVAVRDYALHMQMFRFFHRLYPQVHLSLHAGELTPELVGKEALKDHIRQAVEIASAERIGHGVDIAGEENSAQLLKKMAKKKILVEINLTSNEEILNVKGKEHPLSLYQKAQVPVSLSTDDEGISRGNLTQEYTRAVLDQGASYKDLKSFSRTGLEYAFLPGKSLWKKEIGGEFVKPCQTVFDKRDIPDKCRRYLEKNAKAKQELELEKRFHIFEYRFLKGEPNA